MRGSGDALRRIKTRAPVGVGKKRKILLASGFTGAIVKSEARDKPAALAKPNGGIRATPPAPAIGEAFPVTAEFHTDRRVGERALSRKGGGQPGPESFPPHPAHPS